MRNNRGSDSMYIYFEQLQKYNNFPLPKNVLKRIWLSAALGSRNSFTKIIKNWANTLSEEEKPYFIVSLANSDSYLYGPSEKLPYIGCLLGFLAGYIPSVTIAANEIREIPIEIGVGMLGGVIGTVLVANAFYALGIGIEHKVNNNIRFAARALADDLWADEL